ncbi:LacI family DNA-binding transcriptional regulator [Salinarimonas ramus]|uniref:Transcriptional regulator n=1 Tax=Salinarimonas ramus TaxID=690164 RepID=A0A917Q363_9HYPH|nr:LacI family DNA-binding transcriptional regulator [Salinarimonas ramus]GGK18799.1 transcriptional regulator [Salinarimonas ramus]
MERRQPRLKELSSELGLSITTVSRALAGYSDVSPATRERVREAAARSGYVPNRAGRALKSGQTGFVGLVVPVRDAQFIDAFLGEFVMGLGEALAEAGRDLALTTATRRQDELDVLAHVVNAGQVDGMVVSRTTCDDPRVRFLVDRGVPFVLHGRVLGESRPHVWLDTDGEAAFAEAARRLIALGHRRFGLVTFSDPMTFVHYRRAGLEAALRDAGLALAPEAVAAAPRGDREALAAAIARVLDMPASQRPTAILCMTDTLAIALMEAARERSIAVPADLSVIGFDNLPVSSFARPGLTTFDARIHECGVDVARMLLDVIANGPAAVEPRLVAADFIARDSHGPAPGGRGP